MISYLPARSPGVNVLQTVNMAVNTQKSQIKVFWSVFLKVATSQEEMNLYYWVGINSGDI